MSSKVEMPAGLVMPEPLQTIFLAVTAMAAVFTLVFAITTSARQRDITPVLLIVAAFCSVLLEPVVSILGHVVHPAAGQKTLFEAFGRAIPWHIAWLYTAAFGLFYLVLYKSFANGDLTEGKVWRLFWIGVIGSVVGEVLPVSSGLWVYYGYQPLHVWSGTVPITWSFLNTVCMVVAATLMFTALTRLEGDASKFLLLLLGPAGAFMGHLGAGFLMYTAMKASAPNWLIQLAGAASVLLSLVLTRICAAVLRQAQTQTVSMQGLRVQHA